MISALAIYPFRTARLNDPYPAMRDGGPVMFAPLRDQVRAMLPAPGRYTTIDRMALVLLTLAGGSVRAGEADVIGAKAHRTGRGIYDLDVTVRSRDTGWDRYADQIEVLAPGGKVLAVRVLEHPHETEQPFTRDVPQVHVPLGVDTVTIRARFKPVGFDGETFQLRLNPG